MSTTFDPEQIFLGCCLDKPEALNEATLDLFEDARARQAIELLVALPAEVRRDPIQVRVAASKMLQPDVWEWVDGADVPSPEGWAFWRGLLVQRRNARVESDVAAMLGTGDRDKRAEAMRLLSGMEDPVTVAAHEK